jgi:hypothetical protein
MVNVNYRRRDLRLLETPEHKQQVKDNAKKR